MPRKPRTKQSTENAKPSPGIAIAPTEFIPFEKVNPAPYNPRKDLKPGDPEWAKLEHEMLALGFVGGMVWNRRTGHLVGGHQRRKILLHHGHAGAPMAVVDLPIEQEKALNLALNNPKLAGDWDREKLAELLTEIERLPGVDLEVTGFDTGDIEKLYEEAAQELREDDDGDVGEDAGDDGPRARTIETAFGVMVHCKDEKQQRSVFEMMKKRGFKCRVMTL